MYAWCPLNQTQNEREGETAEEQQQQQQQNTIKLQTK